ncbi:hypothetical protein D3C71_2114590 [compost metagenome]
MGDAESKVDKIENWKTYTLSTFKYEVLEGGHFFIYDNAMALSGVIKEAIKRN